MKELSQDAQDQLHGGDFSLHSLLRGAACGGALALAAGSGGAFIAGAVLTCSALLADDLG